MGIKSLLKLMIILTLSFHLTSQLWAQEAFPTKPIHLIVPFAAGSGTDTEARGMQPYMEKYLKVRVIIENVPGAGCKIGLTKTWKSKPDGYTLLYHIIPTSITNQYMLKGDYQVRDFTHIYAVSKTNSVLTVPVDSWKTWDEFLKAARSRTLSAATSAIAGAAHLVGMAMAEKLGLKISWVPYEGGSDAVTAVSGKHLDIGVTFTTTALTLVDAGKLRPLVVFSEEKDPTFPQVPTIKQLGYDIRCIAAIRGIVGPPGVPPARAKILEAAMAKVVQDPGYLDWTKKRRMDIVPFSAAEYLRNTVQQYEAIDKFRDVLDGLKGSEKK